MASSSLSASRFLWLQRGFLLAIVCLMAAVTIQYTFKATANRSAIVRWRDQIQRLDDEDIYARHAYPNPPIMAMLLKPIAELPPVAGSLVWFYLKILMTCAAVWCVFRFVESPDRPFPAWAQGLALILSLRPIMGDLSHGNVNLFILFLVVLGLYAWRRGRDSWGGASIALAISCKVTPALFVPYLVWKRAWKMLAGCGLGLVLFLIVIPSIYLGFARGDAYLGFETNNAYLKSWAEKMILPFVVQGEVTSEHQNQSLPGLLYRLTTASPSFQDQETPPRYDNFLSLERGTVKWILKGCMLLFGLLVLGTCRTSLTHKENWRLAAEFSLVVVGMMLFSERTWKHHCVTMLLPFSVLSYYLAICRPGRLLGTFLAVVLGLSFVLMASTSTALIPHTDAKMAQVYGAYVWTNLLLTFALAVILLRPAAASADEPATLSTEERAVAHSPC